MEFFRKKRRNPEVGIQQNTVDDISVLTMVLIKARDMFHHEPEMIRMKPWSKPHFHTRDDIQNEFNYHIIDFDMNFCKRSEVRRNSGSIFSISLFHKPVDIP